MGFTQVVECRSTHRDDSSSFNSSLCITDSISPPVVVEIGAALVAFARIARLTTLPLLGAKCPLSTLWQRNSWPTAGQGAAAKGLRVTVWSADHE